MVMGVALFVIELVHPGAFLLIPGSVLLVGGLTYTFIPAVLLQSPWGAILVALAAMLAAAVSVPAYRRLAPVHRPMVSAPVSLVGRIGLVTTTVRPNSLSGKVQVDSEIWSARSETTIAAGTMVEVVGGEGVCVIVRPVPPSSTT